MGSNIDWGQDLLYLKRWLNRHPEAQPFRFAYYLRLVDPRIAGIEYELPPVGQDFEALREAKPNELGPKSGWYAVSVNELHRRTKEYRYFLHFKPAAMAGYSIYIYHIGLDEANRVRRSLGLPRLTRLHSLRRRQERGHRWLVSWSCSSGRAALGAKKEAGGQSGRVLEDY